MQAADERLVLEQRESRLKEAGENIDNLVVEDPQPVFFRELVIINPVALIWVGICVAIPLIVCSLLNPLETTRGKLAQAFVHLIYGPLMFAQVGFLVFFSYTRF